MVKSLSGLTPISPLNALPSPINMTTTIRHASFPLLLDPTGKPNNQVIHSPTANFGPLSRGSVINFYVNHCDNHFNTYLTPKLPGAWVCAKTRPILNVAP